MSTKTQNARTSAKELTKVNSKQKASERAAKQKSLSADEKNDLAVQRLQARFDKEMQLIEDRRKRDAEREKAKKEQYNAKMQRIAERKKKAAERERIKAAKKAENDKRVKAFATTVKYLCETLDNSCESTVNVMLQKKQDELQTAKKEFSEDQKAAFERTVKATFYEMQNVFNLLRKFNHLNVVSK